MARRRPRSTEVFAPPNPYLPSRDPYPDERRVGGNHTSKLGPNMYDQQGQRAHQGRFPWPEDYRGVGDDDEDGGRFPRGYRRGNGSGGYE